MTTVWSTRVMMLMTLEPAVMGTPMISRRFRMAPLPSGRSSKLPRRRWRSSHTPSTSMATTEPVVTPKMAAAAPISTGARRTFITYQARPRPTTSLQAASRIWDKPVGTMLPRPWV